MLSERTYNYTGTVFLELNEDLEPIKVITSITTKAFEVETTGMKDDIKTTIQISYLDGNNIPKLEFEI